MILLENPAAVNYQPGARQATSGSRERAAQREPFAVAFGNENAGFTLFAWLCSRAYVLWSTRFLNVAILTQGLPPFDTRPP